MIVPPVSLAFGRARGFLALLRLCALALPLAGCEAPGRQARAKQEANERWDRTRADLKARLAAAQFEAGEVDAAATELAAALELAPSDRSLRLMEVRVRLSQGALDQAEQALDRLQRQGVGGPETSYLRGVVGQQRGEWGAALTHFCAAAEAAPHEVEYVVAAAQAHLQLRQPDAAWELLGRHEERLGWKPAYQAVLAECLEQLGLWGAAAAAWRRVAGGSEDASLSERLGIALHRAGRWDEAARVLDPLISRAQRDRPSVRLALAECLLEGGDAVTARERLAPVLRAEPHNAHALRLLARCLAALDDFAGAHRVAEQALKADPGAAELAAILALRAGQTDRARQIVATYLSHVAGDDPLLGRLHELLRD